MVKKIREKFLKCDSIKMEDLITQSFGPNYSLDVDVNIFLPWGFFDVRILENK